MQVDTLFINPTSEHPERLLDFYEHTLGIPRAEGFGPDALDAAGVILGIDTHDQTHGPAREPERCMPDFFVNGLDEFEGRLDGAATPCLRRRGEEPWGGVISTFTDPDGNILQLISMGEDPSQPAAITGFCLYITSEQPDGLRAFYRDTVGLPVRPDISENALGAGAGVLMFDTHSAVHGPAREPSRMLIDFWVGDIAAEEARLHEAGVPCIRSQGVEFWGGVFSTFTDPDGNYFQLVQYRPELANEGMGK